MIQAMRAWAHVDEERPDFIYEVKNRHPELHAKSSKVMAFSWF